MPTRHEQLAALAPAALDTLAGIRAGLGEVLCRLGAGAACAAAVGLPEYRKCLPPGGLYRLAKDAGVTGYRAPPGAGLVEGSVDEGRASATFTICTPAVDREGDSVLPSGIALTHYRSNPVWMLEHGRLDYWRLPVGTAEDPVTKRLCVELSPTRATATCFFHQGIKECDDVFSLVAAGVLRATSISFIPHELERLPAGKSRPGVAPRYRIASCELLEISIAIVPMNSEAVRAELGRKSYSPELRDALTADLPPPAAWSNGWTKAAAGLSAGVGSDGGAMLNPDGKPKRRPKPRPDVQAVVVPKKKCPDRQQADDFVKELGYEIDDCNEHVEAWSFNQWPVEQVVQGSDSVEDGPEGCKLILAKRDPASTRPAADEAGEPDAGGPAANEDDYERGRRKARSKARPSAVGGPINAGSDLDAILSVLDGPPAPVQKRRPPADPWGAVLAEARRLDARLARLNEHVGRKQL